MNNSWIKETMELLEDWETQKQSLQGKVEQLQNELMDLQDSVIAGHALIQAYMEKHNISSESLGDVSIAHLRNMSYPEMLIEIAQKRQGYLKVSDAVEVLLRANVSSDSRAIQANIYSALRRLGKLFIKMAPGEYRYTNRVPKQIDTKPSGVRQAVKELKAVNPDMTKQDVYDTLVRRGFNFQGKQPKRAVHMAWVNLGYAAKEKQPKIRLLTVDEFLKEGKQQDLPGVG